MVWLDKVPPLISALAFGYGVGMVTPDAALDDMQAAMTRYAPARYTPGTPGTPGHPAPPPVYGYGPAGPTLYGGHYAHMGYVPPGYPTRPHPLLSAPEQDRLARLRGLDHGAACKLHHDAPAVRGAEDTGDFVDEELDTAGQQALSRLQLPDFNVPITRRALSYVRFLTRTHRGRDMFTAWLKRSGRYAEMVQQNLRERRLPEDLIWLAMIESGFDPTARSPAGATGMWQFMRSTGEVYGLSVTSFVDERKNPVQATRAAAHHLRDLYQRFGSWDLAFAAYNMGYEQLLDRIDRYGTTDFAELSRQRALPKETGGLRTEDRRRRARRQQPRALRVRRHSRCTARSTWRS